MNQRYIFSDTASETLQYAGNVTVDASFDPSEAETVTLDTKWEQFFDTDEYVQFEATVAQPIVQAYFHDGELQQFKKEEQELRTAQAQIDNLPWTMGHPERNRVTSSEQIRGFWADPRWNDGQTATLNIPANDTDAVRFAVQNDNVSIGFSGTLDWVDDPTSDVDAVQRDYAYDHIASVENGRCPPEKGCQLHTDDAIHGHVGDAVRTKNTEETSMDAEMNPEYSVGDWVQWDWSGGTATGRIKSVHTDGPVSVSGTERDPSAEGEPVYKINHWDEQDGAFGNDKIAYESNLSSTSTPEGFTDAAHKDPYEDKGHLFDSEQEARDMAEEIGCDGVHEMGGDWMPCGTHEGYMNATEDVMTDSGCTHICSVGPCSCGAHDPFKDVQVNGEDIPVVPPEAAQEAAQQALDARADEDTEVNGMTSHGWDRAEQLASGEELSPSDIVGSTGAMAPWWSRHEQYSISGESLKEPESDNPWEDNSYTSGKGWGGYSGYTWAFDKGNEIKRARGEDAVYGDELDLPTFTNGDIVEHRYMDFRGVVAHNPEAPYVMVDPMVNGERNQTTMTFGNTDLALVERRDEMMADATHSGTIMDTISYDGLMGGDLDESEIPNEGYEPHYVFDADTKSESSYPLVDGDGNLRRGNVDAAWQLYGRAEDEQFLLDVLAQANKQFADADGYSAPIPEDSLEEAITDSTHTDTMDIQTFIDENDLSAEDVRYILDSADVDTSEVVDAPDEPTDFYDGQADVEALADDFDAVGLLVEQKESLEAEVDSLEDDLRETKRPIFADKAEQLAEMTERWGDAEELMDKFDADDEERWTVDTIEDKIELVEDIAGTETTTVTDSSNESEDDDSLVGADTSMQIADRDSIETTSSGKYNLSSVRE